MNDSKNIKARLAEVEDRLERIEQAETATDDDGREWSVPQVVEMGLSRRQAMLAVGSLAVYGGSIWAAIKHATGNARAATDQVGTASQPVDVFGDTVTTDDVSITNISKGSTAQYADALANNDAGGELRTQATDGVSTSTTVILSGSNDLTSALIIVQGDEVNSGGKFTDLLHFSPDILSPTVINSGAFDTSVTRTYDNSGDDLTLALSSSNWDVVSHGIVTRRDAN